MEEIIAQIMEEENIKQLQILDSLTPPRFIAMNGLGLARTCRMHAAMAMQDQKRFWIESIITILEKLKMKLLNIDPDSMAIIEFECMNTQRTLFNQKLDQAIQLLKTFIN